MADALEIWHVVALAFLGSMLDLPGSTARQSALPALAERGAVRLERLNAAAETIRRLTHLAGPPLAGLLIVVIGPTAVLWLDVASFGVSVALVAGLVPEVHTPPAADAPHWFARVREGFGFIAREPLIRTLVLVIGAVNVLMNPIFLVVLPVYADRTTGEAIDLGLLIGSFGVGSVIAAVSFGAFAARLPRTWLLRIGLLVTAIPVWVLSTIPPVPLALAAMLVVGLAVGGIGPLILTVLGERTPPDLRGRVFGTYFTLVNGAIPFGVLVVGLLLEWVPLGTAVAVLAALYSGVAISGLLARPLGRMA
jgi:MFS family permease